MSIKSITTDISGEIGVIPRIIRIDCDDSFDTITTENYLQSAIAMGTSFYPSDIVAVTYGENISQFFTLVITSSSITMIPASSETTLPVVSGNIPKFDGDTGTLEDSAIPSNTIILNSVTTGQTISASTSSATPGTIRSVTGKITQTATTMTSGNIVGTRGEVDAVGASGGFMYGTQGKVIATGTFSGSVWVAGLFGQFDISNATINAAQFASIWGDWGATGATATSLTGCRGIAFTNTTSNVLNAQDYRYGNATYLQELAGAGGTLNYYASAGTSAGSAGDSTHCAAQKVLKILINGVAAYIPVFTQNT